MWQTYAKKLLIKGHVWPQRQTSLEQLKVNSRYCRADMKKPCRRWISCSLVNLAPTTKPHWTSRIQSTNNRESWRKPVQKTPNWSILYRNSSRCNNSRQVFTRINIHLVVIWSNKITKVLMTLSHTSRTSIWRILVPLAAPCFKDQCLRVIPFLQSKLSRKRNQY